MIMSADLTRRRFIRQSMGLLSALSLACRTKSGLQPRPNIIFFLADDLGSGDLGCYGNTEISTPNIDGLARQGVKFTAFYANAPECTPTRTALLTGRYQHRVGGLECALGIGNVGRYDDAIRLRQTRDMGLPVEEVTLARMLKDAGYHTALYGKWHLGYESKFSPNAHGFDSAFYAIGGAMDYFHHVEPPPSGLKALYRDGQQIEQHGYFTRQITDECLRFLDQQTRADPFFLYVPYTAPHSPYQGPDDDRAEPLPDDSPLWNQSRGPAATYRAMIEEMDHSIGTVLDKLREKQLQDNTLVVFMSDNGASRSGSNGRFRDFKGRLFEGGIRVPCIASWPGVLTPGAVSEQPCMSMDFAASTLAAAGVEPPAGRSLDGIDILEQVRGGGPVIERTLFWRARRGEMTRRAVRHGDLKYIHEKSAAGEQEVLFDLAQDPEESENLLPDREREAAVLKQLLRDWEEEVKHKR